MPATFLHCDVLSQLEEVEIIGCHAMFCYLFVESRVVLALVVVLPVIGKMFCCVSVSIVLDSGMLLLLSLIG